MGQLTVVPCFLLPVPYSLWQEFPSNSRMPPLGMMKVVAFGNAISFCTYSYPWEIPRLCSRSKLRFISLLVFSLAYSYLAFCLTIRLVTPKEGIWSKLRSLHPIFSHLGRGKPCPAMIRRPEGSSFAAVPLTLNC